MLDLLQHRVGQPMRERVAGEQKHRQPVGVRDPGGGDHVGAPGPIEDSANMKRWRRAAFA